MVKYYFTSRTRNEGYYSLEIRDGANQSAVVLSKYALINRTLVNDDDVKWSSSGRYLLVRYRGSVSERWGTIFSNVYLTFWHSSRMGK